MPIEPEIILIPEGPLKMGVPDCPPDTSPHAWSSRDVHVPTFGIAKYAVTVTEYLAFARESNYAICETLYNDPRFQDPHVPAAFISWIDAVRYTHWLARETRKSYRLVRDAEYERAARGGLEGRRFPWGDEDPQARADFDNPNGSPMPVGSFPPNGFGLHDMVGSMWTWCEECFDQVAKQDRARLCYEDTLIKDVRLNPICRGGSFKTSNITWLYCAYRHEDPVDGRFDCVGLRIALGV